MRASVCHKQRGFTLTELLITVAVLGVLLAVGLPSFKQLIASNRIATQANEFMVALNLARSEAVRRAEPVAIRSSSANAEYGTGWKVFRDPNSDGDIATATDLVREGTVSNSASVQRVTRSGLTPPYTYATSTDADKLYLIFTAQGASAASDKAFFRICDSKNSTMAGRIVEVSTVGRVSIVETSVACPAT